MTSVLRCIALLLIAASLGACAAEDAGSGRGDPARNGRTAPSASATPSYETVCAASAPPATVFCADTAGMETATVIKIVDGDTFDVLIGGAEARIRIFGIDTPERGDLCFAEASALLAELAADNVRLRTDVRTVDRNGRLLRYVYRPDGLSIDAAMIAAGAALAWTRDGALRDELVALEAEARARRAGCLWG